jgi:Bcr/CflA subfamily drug resistance transporter
MSIVILPAIWLIVLIVGLPQFSETVYSPSLPDIACALRASESMVEYTLTIYLFGFAIGNLIWGTLSDRLGRKPCILAGFSVFVLGCIGCYFSTSITQLLFFRFVQALGGSVGSVLGQAVCRDAFSGPGLGKVYSIIGSSLGAFPAIGPVIGGFIAQQYGWSYTFLFLIVCAMALMGCIAFLLPETLPRTTNTKPTLLSVASRLVRDTRVLGFGLVVALANGISFSYFAEGSFFLIKILGMSPAQYGISFVGIAASTVLGGALSHYLHNFRSGLVIMWYGIVTIVCSTAAFSVLTLLHVYWCPFPAKAMIGIAIGAQMFNMLGRCLAVSNALALSLVHYKESIGSASSLFICFYYCVISLCTLGMGALHNGTLLPMPLYFFGLAVCAALVRMLLLPEEQKREIPGLQE